MASVVLLAFDPLRSASGCSACQECIAEPACLAWSCSSSWRHVMRVVKILGVVPASLVFFLQSGKKARQTTRANNSVFKRISVFVLHKGSWVIARRKVKLVVEGLENVPRNGPVLIVARHFHHLYDGCVLMRVVPRRIHIFVALDWVRNRWLRSFMELACTMVDWPIVLRAEQLNENAARHSEKASRAYSLNEARSYEATTSISHSLCRMLRSVYANFPIK